MAATIDDLLAELKDVVALNTVANTLQQANTALLTTALSGTPGRAPTPTAPAGQQQTVRGGRATAPAAPAGQQQPPGFFGRMWQNSRFGQAFGSKQASAGRMMGGQGASGTQGLGGGAGAAAKAAGVVGVVVAVGQALNEFRKAVQNATTAQLEGFRRLSEMSGPMAQVFARRDVKDMLRDQKHGDQVAGSAGKLADAEARRKDAMLPVTTALENLQNQVLEKLNDVVAGAIDNMKEMANKVIHLLTKLVPGIREEEEFFKKEEKEEPDAIMAAIAGPGGVLAKAKEIEDRAAGLLADAKKMGGPFGRGAAPRGRLP